MEKKIDTKDLKENVSTLLEKSTDLTERVEALEKPMGAQNSASACQENRIQIELLQPHGKKTFDFVISYDSYDENLAESKY